MKKILLFLLLVVCIFTFCACAQEDIIVPLPPKDETTTQGGNQTMNLLFIGDSKASTEFTKTMLDDVFDNFDVNWIRDTIPGATFVPYNTIGVVEHIDTGYYEQQVEQKLSGKLDYVIIQRSCNDIAYSQWGGQFKMGSFESTDKNETYGAMRYTIEYFQAMYPDVKIVFTSSTYRFDVETATTEAFNSNLNKMVGEYKNVSVFDLYTKCGVTKDNYKQFYSDGIHQNEEGLDVWTECYVNYFATILSPKPIKQIASKDSVKILAIGNSFSDNAMNHLYGILKAFGAKEIVLGNMYIGGCTVATHYNNMVNDSASYIYRKNDSKTTNGSFVNMANTKLSYALADEKWDLVTFQQASHDSGMPNTYDTEQLNYMVDFAKGSIDNTNLQTAWHMTWAYQTNATHSAFPNYGSDQKTMYDAIIACVNSKITTNDRFNMVIPAGTAVQNARTSYIGDTLTADGYHLNALGEYIIGVTWVLEYTGWNIDDLDESLVPSQFAEHIDVIKESAVNAVKNPFAITQSKYTANQDVDVPDIGGEIDTSKYKLLTFDASIGYYNSTAGGELAKTLQTNQSFYITNNKRFTKEDLPNGTIIIIAEGWQYRPDGWTGDTTNTAGRPNETQATKVVVDDAWWGSFTLRAFNISKQGKPALTADDLANISQYFQIWVPID